MSPQQLYTIAAALWLPTVALAQSTPASPGQTYPGKAVRLIVPFPPGGSTDLMGRVLGAKLGEAFNQQVIVENRQIGKSTRLNSSHT